MFGILRWLILVSVKNVTGRRPQIENRSSELLLISEVWKADKIDRDHVNLRRRLLNALRDAWVRRLTNDEDS